MHPNLHNVRRHTFFDSMVWCGAGASPGPNHHIYKIQMKHISVVST